MVEIMSECPSTIYLINIPLKPSNKVEIQELQSALIIATLADPRIFEVLSDPVERVLFADELFVAAAALAMEKAGYSISQIAEELGRSETTIRAHLEGATKIGKIVREAYDTLTKLSKIREELPVRRLDIAVAVTEKEVEKFMEMIKRLESENDELRKTIRKLEEELNTCKLTIEKILGVLKERISEILKEKISELLKLN